MKLKKIFKKGFGIVDLVLIAIILPQLYFVYQGISYDRGFLAIYSSYIAPIFIYGTVTKWLYSLVMNKRK